MSMDISNKTVDDVMVCPKCGSDNCDSYDTDEVEFNYDGTGHYNVDCACKECGNHFRLYMQFKYAVTSSHT